MIICKIELKLKWEKYCVLSAAGSDNVNAKLYYFHYQRHKAICPCWKCISKKQSNLSKLLSKRFEISVYWNEYKTKSENTRFDKWIQILFQIKLELIEYLF